MPQGTNYHFLLILYQYPLGSAQTIRWVNLVRFMIEAGHRFTLLSAEVEAPDRPIDKSLLALLNHPHIETQQVASEQRDGGALASFQWARRAVKVAQQMANETSFDVVISSALPIADHLIASQLKRSGAIPVWIADYGDPWSTSRTLDQAWWRVPLYRLLERWIMRHADAVTITTPTAIDSFLPIYPYRERIHVIPMGASYFHIHKQWDVNQRADIDTVRILYPGSFYPNRTPERLFAGLAQVEGVHLTIIGTHYIDIDAAVENWDVGAKLTRRDYANQRDIVDLQAEYDVLLLTAWHVPEQVSGKFYEYIMTTKPILYVTPHETDVAADYIRAHDNGYIVDDTPEAIAEAFTQIRDAARAGQLKTNTPNPDAGFDKRAEALLDLVHTLHTSR